MFKAKGRGKAAQRESGGRRKRRETENLPFLLYPPLWAWLMSYPQQSRQKALGKKLNLLLPKCETVPEWTSPCRAAVINSERLLLHQAIWLCRKESVAAAELRFLLDPIRPSDIIHSQMLSHHFFSSPSLLLASHFIYLQAVCCTARCKKGSARSLWKAERQHPRTTDAQRLVSLCLPTLVLCVRLEGST